MTATRAKTDHQIQSSVVKELDWSPGVESEHIGVSVSDGAVTLSGEVLSFAQRNAAVDAAMRIHCVVALVDDIVVRSPDGAQDDADIARLANAIFARHAELGDEHISATVHERVVTLSGTVDWNYQREAARRAVESLSGVVDVVDEIAVRPVAIRADAEERILAALERGAQHDARCVEVSVAGHEVTLRGPVSSFKERNEAEQAAWSLRGVTNVHNEIVVNP